MARIRSVHPSLFTDEAWVSCSPLARILYVGLWTDADDQGLFEWKPLQIKMRLLPGDAGDVPEMLSELEGVGLVQAYEAEGKRYGAIANFRKFQRPQKPNAIHPLPEKIAEYVGLAPEEPPTSPPPVADQSPTSPVIAPQMEDGGWKGKDTAVANAPAARPEPSPKRARRSCFAPEGFSPTAEHHAKADAKGLSPGDLERALARFKNHEFPRPYTDWNRCFHNWIDREKPSNERPANDYRAAKSDHLAAVGRAMAAAIDGHEGEHRGDRPDPGDGGGMRRLPTAA